MIEFMAITNDVASGVLWHAAGVQRIMIDLERYGKADRQKFRDTVKSDHGLADVGAMQAALPTAHVVVRCETLELPNWHEHIEAVLAERPTSVMVPMIESAADVESVRDAVRDRADLIVMIETAAALSAVDRVIAAAPTATFFVGLNDLHAELGHSFMFEPLSEGHVDAVGETARRLGVAFGFGGLARCGEGLVDSAAVIKEHVRLGSSLAILARSFFGGLTDPHDVEEIRSEILKLREVEHQAAGRSLTQQQADTLNICGQVRSVAARMKKPK